MNFIVTQIKKLSFVQYSLADRTVQFICIPGKYVTRWVTI